VTSTYKKWREHDYAVPATMRAWPLTGAGFESLGRSGRPVSVPVPKPGPRELLLRVDAVGICFSDVKLIRAGTAHPRLKGRDLKKDPTRPGHEVSLTVAAMGAELGSQYSRGDRFTIQADVYYEGRNLAFGYWIPGGFSEYVLAGKEILEGDEGNYLMPIPEGMGYAETALCEPWACVEASARQVAREQPLPGGRGLIVQAEEGDWSLDGVFSADHDLTSLGAPGGRVPDGLSDLGRLDDVVILGTPSPELVGQCLRQLAPGGLLCIASRQPLSGPVSIDLGRLHYERIRVLGTTSPEAVSAYRANNRTELRPGGIAWFIGAAGPMGQMHVQRALQLEAPPRKIIAADPSAERTAYALARWRSLADRRGVELVTLDPTAYPNAAAYLARVTEEAEGQSCDDIIVLAPIPDLVAQAATQAAPGCVVNIFAGIPVGNESELDLSGVYLRGVRYIGSSGSRIEDLQAVLEKARTGRLDANRSLGVIGGIAQALDAVQRVARGETPAKTVLFPSVPDFPLAALEELGQTDPGVVELLTDGAVWTRAAEERFLSDHVVIP
jgi:threonine dehydrogenase-like Zn-dependent dehydrogenase